MRDPYDVLGVPRGASDDEIKKAYRTLSRKYHPDANINNPDKEKAEDKFKEVQAAYKRIQDEKSGKFSYGGYGGYEGAGTGGGYGPFGGFGQSGNGQSQQDIHMQAAWNYINSRHYAEALNVLDSIPEDSRKARWYFLSAIANSGAGNNVTARQMADKAADMEPGNTQYRNLKEQLAGGGTWYQGMGDAYGMPMDAGAGLCSDACLSSVLCSFCGPGVFCCI